MALRRQLSRLLFQEKGDCLALRLQRCFSAEASSTSTPAADGLGDRSREQRVRASCRMHNIE